jgi:hypothetical protein
MLKKSIFVSFLAIFLLVWSLPIMAEQSATDQAENIFSSTATKTPGAILWHCDVQHLAPPDSDYQIVGIETLRDTIYTTGGNNGLDPNRVHVWLRTGGACQYLYSVTQPAHSTGWGWRDLACDGNYLYGSYSKVLNCFYVTPGGVVEVPANNITVGLPGTLIIRAVAYDPDSNWFWTADFGNSIYAFNRAGTIKRTYANTRAIYGLAYDNITPGGPYLWAHVQDSTNIYQFNPTTGVYTGVVYSGWGDDDPGVTGIAGGLCVLERGPSIKGNNVTLLGITQMVSPNIDEMYAMEIYVAQESLYWKPAYPDYAPSGMPDFDQKQDNWKKGAWQYTFCGPVAVANCFWWFDSKYNVPAGVPGDANDRFPLVRDYLDQLPPLVGFDDHDPWNVNHVNTAWFPGVLPPVTSQPFVPGHQVPGGGLTPWGELVERLAYFFDTDGWRTGIPNTGTNVIDMQQGIQMWLESEHFQNGSTLADTLCEVTLKAPTFATVESLVEKSEDVILLLGFWWLDDVTQQWFRCGGHYVTVAGVNSDLLLIAISDPYYDWAEEPYNPGPGRIGSGSLIPHTIPHLSDPTIHNDAGNVSQDIYAVLPQSPSPAGVWSLPNYPVSLHPSQCEFFDTANVPDEFKPVSMAWNGISQIFTEVEYAVHISPWGWDYRGDVNGDGIVDASDLVYLLNYLFAHGPAPVPLSEADVTCDGIVDVSDLIYLLNYLFVHGPEPKCRVCDP